MYRLQCQWGFAGAKDMKKCSEHTMKAVSGSRWQFDKSSLSLSLVSSFFFFFLSFRSHVIVSLSVTESCKRLELGCILGNTHTHTRGNVWSIYLINNNLALNHCCLSLSYLHTKKATQCKCSPWGPVPPIFYLLASIPRGPPGPPFLFSWQFFEVRGRRKERK